MLIDTLQLREILNGSINIATHAKMVMEGFLTQLKVQNQTLLPSEIAAVSIAANLSIIAACSIKQLELAEKKYEEEQQQKPGRSLLEGA